MTAGENADVEKRGPVQSTLGVLLKAEEIGASPKLSLLKGECENFDKIISLRLSSSFSVPLKFTGHGSQCITSAPDSEK